MIQWMAARSLARTWWPALVGAAVISGPMFLLGQCSGARIERDRTKVEASAALTRNADAREQAAGERARDQIAVDQLKKDLRNATADMPDTAPSERLRRFDCQRLRNAGVSSPEC